MNAVVLLVDNNTLLGAQITLTSLLKHSKRFNLPVVVLYWEESLRKKDLLLTYPNIQFRKIDQTQYPQIIFDNTFRKWKYNCLYRFEIFKLSSFDKILYIDSDIIFQTDVMDIFKESVDFGAVIRPQNIVPQIDNAVAFSAGVMLIDKKILNFNIFFNLIQLATSSPESEARVKSGKWIGNEPILNKFFGNIFTPLPNFFNLCTDVVTLDNLKTPANIHFIGHNKPWTGQTTKTQFDKYILDKIVENNGKYSLPLIISSLKNIYHKAKY